MAILVFKTFAAGEVLTASDLNSSLTQIVNNGADLVTPFTKDFAAGGYGITGLRAGAAAGEAVRYEQLGTSGIAACDFRLTLTTAVPVTTSDVTAATTIYCTPYKGNRIALYDGTSAWNVRTSAEFSLAIGTGLSSLPYDIFCYDNSGVPTLEQLVWTNGTTRATALTTQNGVLVKSGATTRRYLGTYYPTSTTTTEDSVAKRYLWNYYNRVDRAMRVVETTNTWSYATATKRSANNSAANRLNFVIGVSEGAVRASVIATVATDTVTVNYLTVTIGLDSATAAAAETVAGVAGVAVANTPLIISPQYTGFPGIGVHYLNWIEAGNATGTVTWYGDGLADAQSGIHGVINA